MAEDDGKRQLRRLEGIRHCKEARQFGEEWALPLAQRARVVADHMERPEDDGRAGDMRGKLVVELPQQSAHARGVCPDIRRHPGARRDVGQDHHAAGDVLNRGREASGMGSPGAHRLARAVNVVDGKVLAEAHDVGACLIRHLPAFVGEAAFQRLRGEASLPAWKLLDVLRNSCRHAHASARQGRACCLAAAKAIMPVKAKAVRWRKTASCWSWFLPCAALLWDF